MNIHIMELFINNSRKNKNHKPVYKFTTKLINEVLPK